MWAISYLNLNNIEVELRGGFNSDKDAIDWVKNNKVIALELLIWSEYLQNYRTVLDFTKSLSE